MLNSREKEYCNYQPKFTGKGLRIAVLEFNATPNRQLLANINVQTPVYMMDTSPMDSEKEDFQHCVYTCGVIRDMLPDAELYLLPQNDVGINWIMNNNIHIVNASLFNIFTEDYLEEKMAKTSLCICASGNKFNSPTEGITAQLTFWTSVTAMHLENGIPTFRDDLYSYGLGAIDLAGFSNIEFPQVNGTAYGTSFSAPWVVGLLGQYYEAYKLKLGFYPTISEAKDFIAKNCKPIVNDKIKEGFGLFILPNLDTYNFGMSVRLNSTEVNNNGIITQTTNPMQLINNKTMVELTVLRNLGLTVYWDAKNNRAIVVK